IENTNKISYKLFKFINISCVTIYFIWYIIPVFRSYFYGGIFNILIIGLLIVWFLTGLVLNPNWVFKFNIHLIIVSIQLFVFILMALLETKTNAMSYLKIGISFWFTLYVYHFYVSLGWYKVIRKVGITLLISLGVTSITTLIGLSSIPNAARILTSSSNQDFADNVLYAKNIGGFDFIYGLIVLVPSIIGYLILHSNVKSKFTKALFSLFTILIVFVVLNASFTIAIFVLLFSIMIGFLSKLRSRNIIIITIVGSIFILLIPNDTLGLYSKELSQNIDNTYVSERFNDIGNHLLGTINSSRYLSSRLILYELSYDTFKSNPLGIGSYYYVNGVGIGYHSQLLDDLARYGIFALLFYIFFFYTYYRYIDCQWKKLNFNVNFLGSVSVFLLISIINPIFSSQTISIIIFFLLPALPNILGFKMNKRGINN